MIFLFFSFFSLTTFDLITPSLSVVVLVFYLPKRRGGCWGAVCYCRLIAIPPCCLIRRDRSQIAGRTLSLYAAFGSLLLLLLLLLLYCKQVSKNK